MDIFTTKYIQESISQIYLNIQFFHNRVVRHYYLKSPYRRKTRLLCHDNSMAAVENVPDVQVVDSPAC